MSAETALTAALDSDIKMTHQRFMHAMESRLGDMAVETKERYFAVLSALVVKLETPGKPLREILQELMSEAASLIFAELGVQE